MNYLFDKNWFEKYQHKLLWLLNTPLIRIWFRWVMRIRKDDCPAKIKIDNILPNNFTYNTKTVLVDHIKLKTRGWVVYDISNRVHRRLRANGYPIEQRLAEQRTTDFRVKNKYSNRLYSAFKWVWYLCHAWDLGFANRFSPKLNLGFDTLTVYPAAGANSPVDGPVHRDGVNESFATIRAGAGNGAYPDATTAYINNTGNGSTGFVDWRRGIILFDTSALTSGATISAGVLSLYIKSEYVQIGNIGECLVSANPANTNNLVNADYAIANFGTTELATRRSITSDNNPNAYYGFTLNASGLSNVSKTAISKFGNLNSWDFDNTNGSTGGSGGSGWSWATADDTSGTKDPKLVITYSLKTTYDKTVTAKGRIKTAAITKTITAKGRIKTVPTKTITAKGRIKKLANSGTIQAKGRIKNTLTKTIQAKGRIKVIDNTKTIQAKGRVKQVDVTKTIQAKAKIVKNISSTIQAKGRIKNAISGTIQALGRIKKTLTPFLSNFSLLFGGTGNVTTSSFALSGTVLTVSGWVKLSLSTLNQAIMTDNITSATIGHIWVFRYKNFNRLYWSYADGSLDNLIGMNTFFTGYEDVWVHFAIIADYSSPYSIKFYRNGDLIQTSNMVGTPVFPITNNVKRFGNNITNGNISNLRIYNRRLTDLEIKELYGNGNVDPTGLQGEWKMDNGSGLTATDTSGNNRNGTLSASGVSWSNDSPIGFLSFKARVKIIDNTKTIQARATIVKSGSGTIQAKADIKNEVNQTIQAKADIKNTNDKSIESKVRVKIIDIDKTVQAKGRIKNTLPQTIQSKARIKSTIPTTIQAKASILNLQTKTIQARGRIKVIDNTKTIRAKGRIKVINNTATIQAKGRIKSNLTKTIQAKARIKNTRTGTIAAKSRIKTINTKTIQAKAKLWAARLGVIEGNRALYGKVGMPNNARLQPGRRNTASIIHGKRLVKNG